MTLEQLFVKIDSSVVLLRPYLMRLWNYRKYIIVINLMSLIFVLLWLVVLYKPSYEAEIVILPDFNSPSQTAGSIAQLSTVLGLGGGGASMELYENLIKSEPILANVIFSKYYSFELKDTVDLTEIFQIKPNLKLPPQQWTRYILLRSLKSIKELIITDLDIQTKILTVKVQMPESQLAADVANNIILSLDNYLNTKRKSKASNQLFYIDKRIYQVEDSLVMAEESLKAFSLGNRVVHQSPDLLLEQNRLDRSVNILQTVYVELTRQKELIKLDEIRETPVLNVREIAKDPVEKANPNRRLKFCVAMFLSIALSGMYFMFLPEIEIVTKKLKGVFRKQYE